jgi:hypothetical protein
MTWRVAPGGDLATRQWRTLDGHGETVTTRWLTVDVAVGQRA